ncbi:MAG TPA: trehalase family glycosidase [Bryobacteraceae bacterium]
MSILKRRDFFVLLSAAPAASTLSASPQPARGAAETSEVAGAGFPKDDYTPFGYLDNPWHSWDLNPSGVLRSVPGIGMAWYYPAGPGGYFNYKQNNVYALELSLGFLIDGKRYLLPEDFGEGALTSPHHSKNVLSFLFRAADVECLSTFTQVDEHAMAAIVRVTNHSSARHSVRLLARHTYRLGGAVWWGRDGLAGSVEPETESVSIHSFAAGTVATVSTSRRPAAYFVSATDKETEGWLEAAESAQQATSYYPEPMHTALRFEIALEGNKESEIKIVLARGVNRAASAEHARTSLASTPAVVGSKTAEDDAFWSAGPRLEGDWPAHWKRGWVYDFETLRMMVRRPLGVYKHPWDAMQIQAPRNVLAETSIDMWALSYAAPDIAKAVFLGQFQDALAENIPCMREDGVMNMIAADGAECGTSISWCYPFFCAESIFDRTQDRIWLRELYPGLARLLEWTLRNRIDKGGFLVGRCSWETGMDASKRFLIQQPTGGEVTEFVRLPELQAAGAHAGRVLARFAPLVGDSERVEKWKKVESTFTTRAQALWKDGWFRDFDARSRQLITHLAPDPAQSGPIFCGVATDAQMREALSTLRGIFEKSQARGSQPAEGWDDGLAWSSLVLPYLESVWRTGDRALAADVVHAIAERIYRSMDRRAIAPEDAGQKRPALGWPGVSCEIWGAHGAFGGEGYGWGAVMPAHIIRNLLGIRETADAERLMMCPNLPAAWMTPGKSYALRNLPFGERRLNVSYRVQDAAHVHVMLSGDGLLPIRSIRDSSGRASELETSSAGAQFTAVHREVYELAL